MEVPIYLRSPSIITIFLYLLFSYYGYKKLSNGTLKFSFKWFIKDFTSSIFLLGIPVLIGDTFWVIASLLRFGAAYPDSVLQLLLCILRDLAGLVTCFVFEWDLFKRKVVGINKETIFWIMFNILFITVWFLIAPDPSLTDFTYAIRFDYSLVRILQSVFISHCAGRYIIFLTYRSMWRI